MGGTVYGLFVLMCACVTCAQVTIQIQKFAFDSCCWDVYGTTLWSYGRTSCKEECAALCQDYAGCTSFLYNKRAGLCQLNDVTFPARANDTCPSFSLVDYGEVTTLDPIRHAPLQKVYCEGPCTNDVDGYRLCDGNGAGLCHPKQGRIEVYYSGTWGTVCDDWWESGTPNTPANINVTCRIFGYNNGGVTRGYSYFGQGTGDIWLDDVTCTGTETTLIDCYNLGWGVHNCAHAEDQGIECN